MNFSETVKKSDKIFSPNRSAKYFENENIIDSIKYANECASYVVKQRGVSVI